MSQAQAGSSRDDLCIEVRGNPSPEPMDNASPQVAVNLFKTIPYKMDKAKDSEPIEVTLQMRLLVSADEDFETRHLCEGTFTLFLPNGSHGFEAKVVSTVCFSLFTGRPSECLTGINGNLATWAEEWHKGPLQLKKYTILEKEVVYAVRALYDRKGFVKVGEKGRNFIIGPHETDTLVFISKIETGINFAGKGLLKHILDMVFLSLTHKDLPDGQRIHGPVCCILEPGFIVSNENEQHWPKRHNETEEERCHRVVRTLTKDVYPKVKFELYRSNLKEGSGFFHSYLGRRVRAYPHSPGGETNTGSYEPLTSRYDDDSITYVPMLPPPKKPRKKTAHKRSRDPDYTPPGRSSRASARGARGSSTSGGNDRRRRREDFRTERYLRHNSCAISNASNEWKPTGHATWR